MYEFIYEAFEFLRKFQVEIPAKIFVITNEDSFDFYYVEEGIMFTSSITFNEILEHMKEEYDINNMEDAIELFKSIYFKKTSEPLDVKKDNDNDNNGGKIDNKRKEENKSKIVNINIQVAEKLRDVEFVFV